MTLPRLPARHRHTVAVGAVALTVLFIGLARSAWAVGGADSYGYVSQAYLWRDGRALTAQPLPFQPPWPNGAWSLAPLGYRESVDGRGIVSSYPPGLPILMALSARVGGDRAIHAVVPICGALAVCLVAAIGRRLSGEGLGIAGAVMLAASPTFLYQIVQPMSDVPVTACCLAALLWAASARRIVVVCAGLASALAILIRPNLAPLSAIACGVATLSAGSWRSRAVNGSIVALPSVSALIAILALQAHLYGSPTMSGYGPAHVLYSADRIPANLWRYLPWLAVTHTPLILAGYFWPLVGRRTSDDAYLMAWACWVTAVVCLSLYLPYVMFEDWWYTRFLLPAVPLLLMLSCVIAQQWRPHWRAALPCVVAVIVLGEVAVGFKERVLSLRDGEQRYPRFAQLARALTPPDAAIITLQHSGALRLYANRLTIRWDVIPPEWLDRSIEYLQTHGRPPFLAIEDAERRAFIERFGEASRYGRLDWIPLLCRNNTCLFDPAQAADVTLRLAR